MGDTFGGKWTRPDPSGRGHSAEELQCRAGFDNQATTSASCLLVLGLRLIGLAIVAAFLTSSGVIA